MTIFEHEMTLWRDVYHLVLDHTIARGNEPIDLPYSKIAAAAADDATGEFRARFPAPFSKRDEAP